MIVRLSRSHTLPRSALNLYDSGEIHEVND
ncbi:hypothetical protein A28LD_0958 [Idiomarina sp. A28L]|nr:hypothetical protein A28LD_0958 [Idiomarina sp. A28L]